MSRFPQPEMFPGSAPAPRRRSWLWLLLLIPVAFLVVCGGLCLGIFAIAFTAIKSSPPYQMALEEVRKDPFVREKLGEPIEDATWFPTGNLEVKNDRGEAVLNLQVAGPKGEANVALEARMTGQVWQLNLLEVTFEDGQKHKIELGGGAVGPADDAPAWAPGDEAPKPEAL